MPVRALNARKKFVAVLSFLALQAGLAAGPLRAGAENGVSPRRAAATSPAPDAPDAPDTSAPPGLGPAAAAPAPSLPDPAAQPPVAAGPAAAALVPPERLYLQPILEQAAQQNGVPADLVLAQAWAESSWRIDAVSGIGAVGVLQLTPDTVDFVSKRLLHLDQDLDALDPAANARMATVYLKHLMEKTDGDLRRALIAYNQGLRSLYRDGPAADAESYADKVLALRPVFSGGA